LSQSKPSREWGNDDGRWLAAIPTLADLKLPNPDMPGEFSWPPPANINYANIMPIFRNPGANWHEVSAEENARRRAEDEKRAEALHEEEARVRNDPKLWRRG
jgi:hypothetical protein